MQQGEPRELLRLTSDSFTIHPVAVAHWRDRYAVLGEYSDLGPRPNLKLSTMIGIWVQEGREPTVIPKPDTSLTYIGAQAVFDSAGRLTVLWHELSTKPRADTSLGVFRFSQVFTSIFDGTRWDGPPREVAFIDGALAERPTVPVRDDTGHAHVFSAGSGRGTHHFTWDGVTWSHQLIRSEFPSVYTTAIVVGTTIHLVYISPAPINGPDRNSVQYTRSYDRGASWSKPILVQHSGQRYADDPQLTATARGELRLVWQQALSDSSRSDVLRIATSEDSGTTWQRHDDVQMTLEPHSLTLITDRCDTTWVLWNALDFGRPGWYKSVFFAMPWTRASWGAPQKFGDIPFYFLGRSPMSQLPGGEVMRVWSAGVAEPNDMHLHWYSAVVR